MLVRGNAGGVRLFTRNGHDWPALSLKTRYCLIDGEAIACEGDACLASTDCATADRTGTSCFMPST
jgi:ATP-dependent DNA ligase